MGGGGAGGREDKEKAARAGRVCVCVLVGGGGGINKHWRVREVRTILAFGVIDSTGQPNELRLDRGSKACV